MSPYEYSIFHYSWCTFWELSECLDLADESREVSHEREICMPKVWQCVVVEGKYSRCKFFLAQGTMFDMSKTNFNTISFGRTCRRISFWIFGMVSWC